MTTLALATTPGFQLVAPDLHTGWLIATTVALGVAAFCWFVRDSGVKWWLVGAVAVVAAVAFLVTWISRLLGPIAAVVGWGGVGLAVVAGVLYLMDDRPRTYQ